MNTYLKWLGAFLLLGTAITYLTTDSVPSHLLQSWDIYAFMWMLRLTYLWGRCDARKKA